MTFDLTEGLNKRQIQCDVLCANTNNILEVTHLKNYKVIRVPRVGKLMSTSISPQLPSYLKKNLASYDVVHVHFPDPMAALALYLQKNNKVPLVVHWHSDIIRQKTLLKLYQPLQDWILKKADRIIATSENYALHSLSLKPYLNKVSVVPIGIDASKIGAVDTCTFDIKKEHPGKKIVFALGRLVYYKGFEFLLKAATAINDDTIIIIGGDGPLFTTLQALIHQNNLTNKVFLVGKIPNVQLSSYFNACDIFCLPAIEKSEAFGVVLLEALYYGKPLVTSDIKESGICWVNQHDKTGYNLPPKDIVALAIKINELLANKEKYAMLSANAKERFHEHFQSEKMVDSMVDVYKEILNRNN